jgi:hypothetical protein
VDEVLAEAEAGIVGGGGAEDGTRSVNHVGRSPTSPR